MIWKCNVMTWISLIYLLRRWWDDVMECCFWGGNFSSCFASKQAAISCHSYLEHRASTKQLQRTQFRANTFNSPHVFPSLLASSSTLLLHEIRGLPLFLWPWGFQNMACLSIAFWFFLRVWPIHLHFLLFIWIWTGSSFVCFQRFSLEIIFGQNIRRIFLKHLLRKTCRLLVISAVTYQVSHPYNNADLTFDLKILSLVFVGISLDVHKG